MIVPVLFLIDAALIIVAGLFIFSSVWVNVCVYRTHEDRIKLIMTWQHRPLSWPILIAAYEAVSYLQHFRARLWRRDPWALYAPIIRESLEHPVTEFVAGVRLCEGRLEIVGGQDGPEKPTVQ